MRPRFGDIAADAAALWRAGREPLLVVGAIFFFLPTLANLLFLPVPDMKGLSDEAAQQATFALLQERMPWFLVQFAAQSFGVGTLLVMLLDPERPSVREALWRTLVRFPGLLAVRIITFSAVFLGLLAFILPGLWMMGRTFLTSPVYMAERGRGPAVAVIAAFERTSGNGMLLFAIAVTIYAADYLVSGIVVQAMLAAASAGPVLVGLFALMMGAALSAITLAAVLLEAAAYRALPPRTGT